VFAGLAARMGDTIELDGGVLEGVPSKFEVLELIRPDTRIPMERVRDEAAEGMIPQTQVPHEVAGQLLVDQLEVQAIPAAVGGPEHEGVVGITHVDLNAKPLVPLAFGRADRKAIRR